MPRGSLARGRFCTERLWLTESKATWRRHHFCFYRPSKALPVVIAYKTFLNTLLVFFDTGLSACILGKTALCSNFAFFSFPAGVDLGTWETGAKRKLGEPSWSLIWHILNFFSFIVIDSADRLALSLSLTNFFICDFPYSYLFPFPLSGCSPKIVCVRKKS